MQILEALHISKSFHGKTVLKDVSIHCQQGEISGIFGRNGTGKSSLLKIISGSLKYDNGSIQIDKKSYSQNQLITLRKIAYLPQESFLPKNDKVQDLIPLFYPEGDAQDRIFYAKGVGDFAQRKVKELSLGQLRYLEILLIGHLEHEFILLDEPFSMIEPFYKDYIKELLLHLKLKKGIVLTDHYYEDVLDIADKNYLINNTRILQIDTKEDLIQNNYIKSREDNSYS